MLEPDFAAVAVSLLFSHPLAVGQFAFGLPLVQRQFWPLFLFPWLVSLLNFPWIFFLCCNIVCTVIIGKFLFEKASKDKKKRSAKSKTLSESKSNKSGVNTQSSALATQSTLIETYSSLRSTMSKIGQYKVFTPERKFVIIMVTYIAQW